MARIAVVGAGVIGLSTAVRIQQVLQNAQVTVIADKLNEDTVSDGAAGIFRPNWELLKGLTDDVARQWSRDGWEHFHSLFHSEDAAEAGISIISGYQFDNNPVREPLLVDGIIYHTRKCTPQDYATFPTSHKYKYGYAFTTLMIECKWYLPYLMKLFKQNNGRFEKREVNSLEELTDYDVVVNATGFRSRELVNDKQLVPIRGQMLRVKAPWIKQFVFSGNHDSWIVPGIDNVVIGGTRQFGREDTGYNQEDKEAMLERACAILPSLKKAEIQWTWVGIRPHREPVRLEKECMEFNGKKMKVVHNYGHGGLGVTLSWGCAVHAATLVQSFLQQSKL